MKDAKPSKSQWKKKILAVIILIGLAFGVYGYFWYQGLLELRDEAEMLVEHEEIYSSLVTALEEESSRCKNFIAQEEGEFSSFNYCQNFIEWSSGLGLEL